MRLKTRCGMCVFKGDQYCIKGKDVFIHEGSQYTDGYCTLKRNHNWYQRYSNEKEEYQDLSRVIQEENRAICPVIISLNGNQSEIAKTVEDLGKLQDGSGIKVPHLFIVTKALGWKFSQWKDFMSSLKGRPNAPWTIESIHEESFGFNEYLDSVAMLPPSEWIMSIEAGKRVPEDLWEEIKTFVCLDSKAVCLNDSANQIFVVNKHAYRDLEGCHVKGFIDKIKDFDNWKDMIYNTTT